MRRLVAILLLLISCSTVKDTSSPPEKCVNSGLVWRYSHTDHWTSQEPVYGYAYNWQSGEYEYHRTGWKTEDHYEDVYSCQERK